MKHHIRDTLCPFCGKVHDRATPATGNAKHEPKAGDLTMCIECGEFSIFAMVPGGLRKPTDDEYLDFATEPEIKAMREVWTKVHKDKPK